jgi:UV DNA damage endonuclease
MLSALAEYKRTNACNDVINNHWFERSFENIRCTSPAQVAPGSLLPRHPRDMPRPPLRLGFPVKVLGQPELKSHDSRRWQSNPHLKFSLGYLHDILKYLDRHNIHMYRMSSDLAPYATHPDMPQFHSMVRDSARALQQFGAAAKAQDLRLSFHPSQYVVLNSPNPALVKKSMWDIESHAEMLDLMELGAEAVIVIHVGGLYGDLESGLRQWIDTWHKLGEPARRRLVLEHDDLRFSAANVLHIHEHTGVRLIFDYQHFWCLNPERLEMRDTLRRFLATWPASIRPKIHFPTPRTEMRQVERLNKKTGKNKTVAIAPIWTGHADFVNPFEFIQYMRMVPDLDFDVMLESKSKDLALIRLRADLAKFAPDVAARFGLQTADAIKLETEQQSVMEVEKPSAA